jgi:hypothetical protein
MVAAGTVGEFEGGSELNEKSGPMRPLSSWIIWSKLIGRGASCHQSRDKSRSPDRRSDNAARSTMHRRP